MPRVKHEPNSPQREEQGPLDEVEEANEELDERFELDFVEESTGDDLEGVDARSTSQRSLSAPHSPDGGEETVTLHPEGEDEEEDQKDKNGLEKQLGPKTPPEGESRGPKEECNEEPNNRARKRRHSSTHSPSKRSSSNFSRNGGGSPPQTYRKRESRESDLEEELTVEERIRQNKKARLVRLREARSRHLGHEYVPPPTSKSSRPFPPQPYFKNPSYYPEEIRDKARPPAPPPPAQKIEPLPGGRLPLVQRRSSPPPFESSATSRQRSPAPPLARRRRTIVEDTFRVTSRRSPPPYSRPRSPPPRRSSRPASSANLGPQTLYPSRRDPYPPPSRSTRSSGSSRDRDYYDRPSSSYRGGSSYSSSESNGNTFIFTGTKYVERPFIPPPPPGKKWNCPKREQPYVPLSKTSRKWNCPKREPSSTSPRH